MLITKTQVSGYKELTMYICYNNNVLIHIVNIVTERILTCAELSSKDNSKNLIDIQYEMQYGYS